MGESLSAALAPSGCLGYQSSSSAVCVALMPAFTFESGSAGLSNIKVRRDDMKRKKCSTCVVGLALLIVFALVSTVFSATVNYRQVASIAIPGTSFGRF